MLIYELCDPNLKCVDEEEKGLDEKGNRQTSLGTHSKHGSNVSGQTGVSQPSGNMTGVVGSVNYSKTLVKIHSEERLSNLKPCM